jgi:omega-hydroxy-beta-dihydromenaquinone-9 sulfotransferase
MPSSQRKKEWAPRIWEGSDYFPFLQLLVKNRLAVSLPHAYIAAVASVVTLGNMVLKWFQNGLHGHRVRETELVDAPVFVVGHWRTGTTLLHELLVLNPRHTFPTTLQCLSPCHHLISEDFLKRYASFLVPSHRPMDNMATGWDRPQEDEFALCLMGLPSPYADVAFPNRPPMFPGSLDLSGLTPSQLATWKRRFRRFLQELTYRDPRRLVLKSPPHTARIPVLLEMFPKAKFVHIVRDPRVVIPSTVNLWKSMAKKHGLQTLRDESRIREKVWREFRTVYDRLEEAKPLIPAGQFHELRYEELVKNPLGEVRRVYEGVGLDGWGDAEPRIEQYFRDTAGYETNKYQLGDMERAEIEGRCGDVIRRYGYV